VTARRCFGRPSCTPCLTFFARGELLGSRGELLGSPGELLGFARRRHAGWWARLQLHPANGAGVAGVRLNRSGHSQ
jgi:hypothetical protein